MTADTSGSVPRDRHAGLAGVVVVIPVYRPVPTPDEVRSLRQLGRVLGHYPLMLATPEGLDPAPYRAWCPNLEVETFAPAFFAGSDGYNRLMLDDGFYARFARWDYLLIHQLDAWVFADRLADWCARGYDYVGSPWLRTWHRDRDRPGRHWRYWRRELRAELWQCLPLDPRRPKAHYRIDGLSGNGGLSLRRIAACREVLAARLPVTELFRGEGSRAFLNEDVFWAGWARRGRWDSRLKVPHWRQGIDFAVEQEVDFAIAQLGHLPFGCHAWPRLAPAWRQVAGAQDMFAAEVPGAEPPA